jgi:hypothetical protein
MEEVSHMSPKSTRPGKHTASPNATLPPDIELTARLATSTSLPTRCGSVTGRAGVAIDNVFLYGKGGYGWG